MLGEGNVQAVWIPLDYTITCFDGDSEFESAVAGQVETDETENWNGTRKAES